MSFPLSFLENYILLKHVLGWPRGKVVPSSSLYEMITLFCFFVYLIDWLIDWSLLGLLAKIKWLIDWLIGRLVRYKICFGLNSSQVWKHCLIFCNSQASEWNKDSIRNRDKAILVLFWLRIWIHPTFIHRTWGKLNSKVTD